MTYELIYAESFRSDVDEALRYIVNELCSLQAADGFATAIENAASILRETPSIKAVSRKPALETQGLREWLVMNYVIVYRFDDRAVYLEHLFHQSQDFETMI